MGKKRNQSGLVQIGGVIRQVLRSCRRESGADLIRIWRLWDDTVGSVIAPNAQPAAFKGRLLLVHVASSSWMQQLRFLKQDMIKKLNLALEEELIEDIKFKIGPL